jgi:uncharacterized repeat protein (TIGR02059 family)
VLALLLSLISIVSPVLLAKASAATVTATGTNPAVCNQTVSNSDSVVAYRLANGDCVVELKRVGTTTWTVPDNLNSVRVLIVGGGGGGGAWVGGGGGGGGFRDINSVDVSRRDSITVQIGAGGTGAVFTNPPVEATSGSAGGSSSFLDYQALGGGKGAGHPPGSNFTNTNPWNYVKPTTGGSGGGGTGAQSSDATKEGWTNGASGTVGQGKNGGNGLISSSYWAAGGGGGADPNNGTGGAATLSVGVAFGGNGGSGAASDITGSTLRYAGGGGGAHYTDASKNGSGGVGGGGGAGNPGSPGSSNYGGGGGGGAGGPGGAGGSGIVIVRYSPVGPSAPNNVSQTLTGNVVDLSWQAPSFGSLTHYQIERSTNGTSWTSIDTVTAATLSYQASNLTPQTNYYFRVAAYNQDLQGTYGYPWTKIYGTSTMNRDINGAITYESGFGLGASDTATLLQASNPYFSRIKYRMDATISGTATYAETDFYKWSRTSTDSATVSTVEATISNLRIPSREAGSENTIHANVEDLNIFSTNGNVIIGKGLAGRLEIWPWDYLPGTSGLRPQGSADIYDFDDAPTGADRWGSFQVHDLSNSNPVFVWNRQWFGENPEVGFGRHSGTHPDWTFCGNTNSCPTPTAFQLQVFVNSPIAILDVTSPSFSSAAISSSGDSLDLNFNENLVETTAATSQFTVSRTRFAGSSETIAVLSVSASGSTITLNLAGTVFAGDTVTVSYVDPSGSDDSNALQDLVGNDVASFSNQPATNNSTVKQSQSPLTITSTTVAYGDDLTLTTSGGSGTGSVTFDVDTGDCIIQGSTLFSSSVGSCTVTATKATDTNYLAESATATITITSGNASLTIAFSSTTFTFGVANSITVTVSAAGKVRFSANGRVIKNCKSISTIPNLVIVSGGMTYRASCNYRPGTRGPLKITARLTPTDLNITPRSSTSAQFVVLRRTGVRG